MKAELPFPPAALTAARALLRREPLTAEAEAALSLLLACVQRALLKKAAALDVTLRREDAEGYAADYVARLLSPAFRPAWRGKTDAALNGLLLNDLFGDRRKQPGWLADVLRPVAKAAALTVPLADRVGGDDSVLERPEPAAVRFYRSSPDKALRGERLRDDEAAGYAELEGVLLTFQLCLREYRDCEWPAAWPSEKRYCAHALLFYERIQPRYDDLKDCQLAYVFDVSSKVASTLLKAAAARWIPYEELPADGLLEYTALFYELRLLELLKRP